MDVKSAYLNGELKEESFMTPPGFDIPDDVVLRFVKAVYSTEQGGRVWHKGIRGGGRSGRWVTNVPMQRKLPSRLTVP